MFTDVKQNSNFYFISGENKNQGAQGDFGFALNLARNILKSSSCLTGEPLDWSKYPHSFI